MSDRDRTHRTALIELVRRGLHEALAFIREPIFLWVTPLAIAVVAMIGPFDTYLLLPFGWRLVYWSAAIISGAIPCIVLSHIALHVSKALGWHWFAGATVAGMLAVVPALAIVQWLERVILGDAVTRGPFFLLVEVALPVIGVNWIVNAVVVQFRAAARADVVAPPAPIATNVTPLPVPTFFQRLPAELGRDVICLRAQNHYVEVTTARGSVTLLMRLGDAEHLLAGIEGMRVHRSWWVALDHVAEFARAEAGGATITLSTGQSVPVARAQREALRAALADRRRAAE